MQHEIGHLFQRSILPFNHPILLWSVRNYMLQLYVYFITKILDIFVYMFLPIICVEDFHAFSRLIFHMHFENL